MLNDWDIGDKELLHFKINFWVIKKKEVNKIEFLIWKSSNWILEKRGTKNKFLKFLIFLRIMVKYNLKLELPMKMILKNLLII